MNISISNIVILLIVIGGPVWFVMRYINMDRERKLRKKDYQEYVDSFVPELDEIDVKASYADRAVLKIESAYRLVSYKLEDKKKIPCMSYYDNNSICCPAFSEKPIDDIHACCLECQLYISRMEKITRYWLNALEKLNAAYLDNTEICNDIIDGTYELSKMLRYIPSLENLQKTINDINGEWHNLNILFNTSQISPYFYTSQEEIDKDRNTIKELYEMIAKQNTTIRSCNYAMCFPKNKIIASLDKLSQMLDSYKIRNELITADDIRGLKCQPVSMWNTDKIFKRIKIYFSLEPEDRKKHINDIREIMDAITLDQRLIHNEESAEANNCYLTNIAEACNE